MIFFLNVQLTVITFCCCSCEVLANSKIYGIKTPVRLIFAVDAECYKWVVTWSNEEEEIDYPYKDSSWGVPVLLNTVWLMTEIKWLKVVWLCDWNLQLKQIFLFGDDLLSDTELVEDYILCGIYKLLGLILKTLKPLFKLV